MADGKIIHMASFEENLMKRVFLSWNLEYIKLEVIWSEVDLTENSCKYYLLHFNSLNKMYLNHDF